MTNDEIYIDVLEELVNYLIEADENSIKFQKSLSETFYSKDLKHKIEFYNGRIDAFKIILLYITNVKKGD